MVGLGERLHKTRLLQGFTQEELARGVTTGSMISQIENNQVTPSATMLARIIERLNLPASEFLNDVHFAYNSRELLRAANEFFGLEKYDAALFFFNELGERPFHEESVETMISHGICFQNTGDITEALRRYDKILPLILGTPELKAKVFYQIADCHFRQHNLTLAQLYGEKALGYYSSGKGDLFITARVNNLLGVIYSHFGNFQESTVCYKRAADSYGSAHLDKQATMFMNLGIDHAMLKQYDLAGQYFREANKMFEKLPEHPAAIRCKYNYATYLVEVAEYQGARILFKECLVVYQESVDSENICLIYSELAKMEIAQANYIAAVEHAREALKYSDDDHSERAFIYRTMAHIHVSKGEYNEATFLLEKSVALLLKYSRFNEMFESLTFLANCYRDAGDMEKAIATLEKFKGCIK